MSCFSRLSLVIGLTKAKTAKKSQGVEVENVGLCYANPATGLLETALDTPSKQVCDGLDVAENSVFQVGHYIVKVWHGAWAKARNCYIGIQIIDPTTGDIFWLKKQNRGVAAFLRQFWQLPA
jgi:hypothetical protein